MASDFATFATVDKRDGFSWAALECDYLIVADPIQYHLGEQNQHLVTVLAQPVLEGTGIGTALIFNGELIPNTELGHLELLKGKGDAEKYAASSIREKLDMGYKKWAKRLTKYYSLMEFYLDPQLFVVGGGVSRVSEKFLPYIDIKTPIVAAKLHNEAGIIGAAYYASIKQK